MGQIEDARHNNGVDQNETFVARHLVFRRLFDDFAQKRNKASVAALLKRSLAAAIARKLAMSFSC